MAGLIVLFIIMLPLFALLIWGIIDPLEFLLFGSRWKYDVEPEYSEGYLRYTRIACVVSLVVITLIFLFGIISIL
ncbi:hypothetical protein NV379_16345 [Paenibacillus sp. N1-5-1-14]|uniref:hypothetical protein n=1 Tax=Paenibacillus radicibacter TaxID=2972488 RepID=UPI002159301A|nr:hypothetical protein [Paenibacillus radicibacter]MCR8644225.1 hypothetical protein [Paenibacillus radicibacter]